MEALRLRVKDLDNGHGSIAIHDATGGKQIPQRATRMAWQFVFP